MLALQGRDGVVHLTFTSICFVIVYGRDTMPSELSLALIGFLTAVGISDLTFNSFFLSIDNVWIFDLFIKMSLIDLRIDLSNVYSKFDTSFLYQSKTNLDLHLKGCCNCPCLRGLLKGFE